MSPDRWEQVEALFAAALEHPPDQRAAYLAATIVDPEARSEAMSLLSAHEAGGRFDRIVAQLCGVNPAAESGPVPNLLDRLLVEQPGRLRAALAGRYTVERELGRGGMATVYLAQDERHHRPVAIKVLRPEIATGLGPERFLREIGIAARLNHPHILALLDSGDADGMLYYAMPFVEGESLRNRLTREPQLPLDVALQIAREVADALSYAHSHDVIHRDIKPENILLSSGHALVADFGIARAITAAGSARLTETGLAIGTPAYMSQEQAAGSSDVDGRSDLYSLGCVLYEMLSGEPPYTGPTPQAILAKKLSEPLPRISVVRAAVPAGVEAALNKALSRTPADRFATPEEFAVALEAARNAPSESEGVRLVGVSRRRWAWIGAGALAVAAGVFVTMRREPPTVYVPGRVVVAPLEIRAGDSALSDFARGFAATLPEAIAREGVAEPVPDPTVGDVLAHATGLSGVVAERLARETGAGLELRGRCSRVPGGTTCEVDVLRMPAKVLRMSVGATGDPTQPAFEAELTERVLVALQLQRTYGDRVTWLGEYMPRSLAALRAFEAGWDLDFEFDNDSTPVHYYVEAARLDTAWVLPAAMLVYHNQDTASLKRLAVRSGLVAGERETAEFVLADIRGDAERSFELARRRFAVNPEWWLFMVTRSAYATGRTNTALAVSGYVDSAVHVPDRLLRRTDNIRGFALHQLGRYQDQLRLARDLERRFPDNQIRERTNEVMALAALGEVDSLRRRLAEWAAIPEGKRWHYNRVRPAGDELMAHGKEREGRELLATALPMLRRRRKTEGCTCDAVVILRETDQLDEAEHLARADLPTVKSMADSLSYLVTLGVVAARRGRPEEAAQYDRLLARAQQRPGLTGETRVGRAIIAGVVGDREEAVRLLEEARAHGSVSAWHAFVHRNPVFFPLRGYPPFERFLKPRD